MQKNKKILVYLIFILFAVFSFTLANFFNYAALFFVAITLILIFFSIKPNIGLIILIVVVPFVYVEFNFSLFGKSMLLPDFIALLLSLSYFIAIIYHKFFIDKPLKVEFPFLLPFFIFWFFSLISSLLSENIYSSLWYFFRYLFAFYVFYVFTPFNILKSSNVKLFRNSLIAWSSMAVFLSLVSIFSFVRDISNSFFRFRFINSGDQILVINFFKNISHGFINIHPYLDEHVLLAEFLLPSIFLLFAFRLLLKNDYQKKIVNIFLSLIFVILLGTFSRGAWISIFISFLFVVFYLNRYYSKRIFVYLFIFFIIIVPLSFQMLRIQTNYQIGGKSTGSRVSSLKIAVRAFKEKPFFGHSPGSYMDVVASDWRHTIRYGNTVDALGILQKVFVENGLFGAISFFLIFLFIALRFLKTMPKLTTDEREFVLVIFLGALSIFIFEFFNTSYYTGKMWLPISFFVYNLYYSKRVYDY